jgi:hypothetical protein
MLLIMHGWKMVVLQTTGQFKGLQELVGFGHVWWGGGVFAGVKLLNFKRNNFRAVESTLVIHYRLTSFLLGLGLRPIMR